MDVFFLLIIVSRYKPVEKVVDPRCRSWIHHGMGRIISLFGGDGTMALIMVNKGNHPQMAQQFRLVKYLFSSSVVDMDRAKVDTHAHTRARCIRFDDQ